MVKKWLKRSTILVVCSVIANAIKITAEELLKRLTGNGNGKEVQPPQDSSNDK